MTDGRFVEQRQCPLCRQSGGFRPVTDGGTHFTCERVVFCPQCSLVFLNPRMSPEALREYYTRDNFSRDFRGADSPDDEAMAYRDLRAARRWRLLERHLPPRARCLEIGCGAGNFLTLLRRAGHEAVGIDASTGYARQAADGGLRALAGMFPDDLPDDWRGFDTVLLFQVIEHVDEPIALLQAVRERLVPGGMLVLEYPDLEIALRRDALRPTYFQNSHLRDYRRFTIELVLRSAGFVPGQAIYEESSPPYDKNVLVLATADAEVPAPSRERGDYSCPDGEEFYSLLLDKLARGLRRAQSPVERPRRKRFAERALRLLRPFTTRRRAG